MVSKDKKWWTFEVLGPSMIYNRFNREISCHHVTASPRHCVSQSFALPPATKPVSHLPFPLPPNRSVICLAPYHCVPHHHITTPLHHCVTALVSHLPCPLPPNQSVICLAPTTMSRHHCVTTLVSHLPCPLPPNQPVICLAPYHCITTSPCHHISQSFALPPATKPVSHLPCPLPLHHHVTMSLC